MNLDFRTPPVFTLHGYSPEQPEEIVKRVRAGAKPSQLKGDFILVVEGRDAITGAEKIVFISTVVAAVPYYFTIVGTKCFHGPNVFAICKAAQLSWKWNWDAVASIALFDHVLENGSLHAKIQRVPAASIVISTNGTVEQHKDDFWLCLYHNIQYTARLQDAGDVLVDILADIPSAQPIGLSLSAGFDSRVLLAAFTHAGFSVQTASMGDVESTDVAIASQLAAYARLPFQRVELTAADYLAVAKSVVISTSGEKNFLHWHTGVYARKVHFLSSALHVAGSNGEFGRSTLFDKGIFSRIVDLLFVQKWKEWLTHQYAVGRRIPTHPFAALPADAPFVVACSPVHLLSSVQPGKFRFGDGLDIFYAQQRVRNFIGLGLALYRSQMQTMSPFLDARFIQYCAHLPRQAKLANVLPRTIIQQLQPKLLDFPTDSSNIPMRVKPGLLYFKKHSHVIGYQKYRAAQAIPDVEQWADAGFTLLGGDPRQLRLDQALQTRIRSWNFAITLGALLSVLQQEGISQAL